jgi:hypothetical protein
MPRLSCPTFLKELERDPDMMLIPLLIPGTLQLASRVMRFVHQGDGSAVCYGQINNELTGRWVEDGVKGRVHLE